MLTVKQRQLPHWTLEGAVYFITFRLLNGALENEEIVVVREHIKAGHGRFYYLYAVQVMPNHVHCIMRPEHGYSLSRILKGIKGVAARVINARRQTTGILWQDESYDRIIRSEMELQEKMKYIYENPLRAGIVEDPKDYMGWYQTE